MSGCGNKRAIIVPDLVSRIRDVVLVRRIFSSGKPQGVGILEWGGDGNGEISLRATWDQGRRDPVTSRRVSCHIKEGFQVSKGKWKISKGESERESKKQGGCAIIVLSIYMHVHNSCL